MKRVLLTGATGFIGVHLQRYAALGPGWEIIRVDHSQGFDLAVPGWSQALPARDVDVVIHLAQSRHYRDFPQQAPDIFRVNVAGTFELLEWARNHGVKRFIFTSTGTVYSPSSQPVSETAPCSPSSLYAASKLAAEHLIQPYSEFFEVVIARLFGVYGPGQRNMLIANMIDRIMRGEEIQLASGLGIFVTPLFINDCTKILHILAQTPLGEKAVLVNVAGDEILPLSAIVAAISAHLKKTPVIHRTNDPPKYFAADNSLLKTFCPDPLTPFDQGIAQTLTDEGIKP